MKKIIITLLSLSSLISLHAQPKLFLSLESGQSKSTVENILQNEYGDRFRNVERAWITRINKGEFFFKPLYVYDTLHAVVLLSVSSYNYKNADEIKAINKISARFSRDFKKKFGKPVMHFSGEHGRWDPSSKTYLLSAWDNGSLAASILQIPEDDPDKYSLMIYIRDAFRKNEY